MYVYAHFICKQLKECNERLCRESLKREPKVGMDKSRHSCGGTISNFELLGGGRPERGAHFIKDVSKLATIIKKRMSDSNLKTEMTFWKSVAEEYFACSKRRLSKRKVKAVYNHWVYNIDGLRDKVKTSSLDISENSLAEGTSSMRVSCAPETLLANNSNTNTNDKSYHVELVDLDENNHHNNDVTNHDDEVNEKESKESR